MAINYNPTKWENGKTILKASHFEKIEKGITDIINYNNSIYTDEDRRKENEIKREEEHNKKLEEINSAVKDMQADYNSLQKIIIDENASANLQNQINDVSSQLAHIENYKIYNVKDYGAKGDGVTDDSESIRKCIEDLPQSNFKLVFPTGVYMQGDGTYNTMNYPTPASGNANLGEPIYFLFKNKKDFIIEGCNSIVKAHPQNGCIINNAGFIFEICENFKINNLTYDGNKDNRKPNFGDGNAYNKQSAFTLSNCVNVELKNINGLNSCMDGICIDSNLIWGNDDVKKGDFIHLENCSFDNNYRQGCSVIDVNNVSFYRCKFTNAGKTYGTAPMSGLDLEEAYGSTRQQKNCKIIECYFKDNALNNLNVYWGSQETIVEHNTFINGGVVVSGDDELQRNTNIINNNFYNSKISITGGCILKNNNIIFTKDTNQHGAIIHSSTKGDNYNPDCLRRNLIENNIIYVELNNDETVAKTKNFCLNLWDTDIINNTFINLYSYSKTLLFTGGCLFKDNVFKKTYNFTDTPANYCDTGMTDSYINNNIDTSYLNLYKSRIYKTYSSYSKVSYEMQLEESHAGKYIKVVLPSGIMNALIEGAALSNLYAGGYKKWSINCYRNDNNTPKTTIEGTSSALTLYNPKKINDCYEFYIKYVWSDNLMVNLDIKCSKADNSKISLISLTSEEFESLGLTEL